MALPSKRVARTARAVRAARAGGSSGARGTRAARYAAAGGGSRAARASRAGVGGAARAARMPQPRAHRQAFNHLPPPPSKNPYAHLPRPPREGLVMPKRRLPIGKIAGGAAIVGGGVAMYRGNKRQSSSGQGLPPGSQTGIYGM